jgi:hypothetical protein
LVADSKSSLVIRQQAIPSRGAFQPAKRSGPSWSPGFSLFGPVHQQRAKLKLELQLPDLKFPAAGKEFDLQ